MTGPASERPRHLALVGLMGAGKTTVGARCAELLGWPFVDLDELIESTTGRTVRDLFTADGVDAFRALERQALADVLASPQPVVVACGGGAVLDPENRQRLRDRAVVVWLRAAPDELARRVAGTEAARRPLLDGGPAGEVLAELADARAFAYDAAAHLTVDTDRRTVDQVADDVVSQVTRCVG